MEWYCRISDDLHSGCKKIIEADPPGETFFYRRSSACASPCGGINCLFGRPCSKTWSYWLDTVVVQLGMKNIRKSSVKVISWNNDQSEIQTSNMLQWLPFEPLQHWVCKHATDPLRVTSIIEQWILPLFMDINGGGFGFLRILRLLGWEHCQSTLV